MDAYPFAADTGHIHSMCNNPHYTVLQEMEATGHKGLYLDQIARL